MKARRMTISIEIVNSILPTTRTDLFGQHHCMRAKDSLDSIAKPGDVAHTDSSVA